ncbi:MAG: NUDIX hydrolase [Planctomycetota bacterium]
MLKSWPELTRKLLASFKVFDVVEVRRRSPRTGGDLGFFVIDTAEWVNVIALTEDQRFVLVRQFRHGPARFTLEIPGGVIEEHETPLEAAARELREETGFEAGKLRFLGTVNPNPAIFSNSCGTVLAAGCHRVGETQPDPGEDLEVVLMTRDELVAAIQGGEVDHALVLAAFVWLCISEKGLSEQGLAKKDPSAEE